MEGTRTKILDILKRRHEATVEDLTRALQLAPATVRRHLDVLQRDGYVIAHPVRRASGRPHYAFALTEAGEAYFPQHYLRVTSQLIREIGYLTPAETSGRAGRELAGLVFERIADEIARTYAPRISGASLEDRLNQAVEALAEEGLVFELSRDERGYRLEGLDCPCRHIADRGGHVCRYDRTLLKRLIGVEPIALEADEGCAYLVPAPS